MPQHRDDELWNVHSKAVQLSKESCFFYYMDISTPNHSNLQNLNIVLWTLGLMDLKMSCDLVGLLWEGEKVMEIIPSTCVSRSIFHSHKGWLDLPQSNVVSGPCHITEIYNEHLMHLVHLTNVLSNTKGFGTRLILDALEIQLHPGTANWDTGLQLSVAWKPAIGLIRSSLSVYW